MKRIFSIILLIACLLSFALPVFSTAQRSEFWDDYESGWFNPAQVHLAESDITVELPEDYIFITRDISTWPDGFAETPSEQSEKYNLMVSGHIYLIAYPESVSQVLQLNIADDSYRDGALDISDEIYRTMYESNGSTYLRSETYQNEKYEFEKIYTQQPDENGTIYSLQYCTVHEKKFISATLFSHYQEIDLKQENFMKNFINSISFSSEEQDAVDRIRERARENGIELQSAIESENTTVDSEKKISQKELDAFIAEMQRELEEQYPTETRAQTQISETTTETVPLNSSSIIYDSTTTSSTKGIFTMDSVIRWLAIIGGMAVCCFPFRLIYGNKISHPVLKCVAFVLVFLIINSIIPTVKDETNLKLEESTRYMAFPETMTVSAVASMNGDTTVGNEWSKYFSVNNSPFSTGESQKITIWQGQKLTALSRIVEEDGVDDIGVQLSEHIVTHNDLKYGFSIRQEIEVKEENGRFSGHSVEWTVVYTFKP